MKRSGGVSHRLRGVLALTIVGLLALAGCGQEDEQPAPGPASSGTQQGIGAEVQGSGGGQQQGTIQGWDRGGSKQETLSDALKGNGCATGAVGSTPDGCQCVAFVVYELFGQRLGGDFPTAEGMATKKYWGREEAEQREQLTRKDSVQAGDVIIMQHDAKVYPWNEWEGKWDCSFRSGGSPGIGWGAGHIGIVESAEYWSEQHGWLIRMWNANWPPAWGSGYQVRAYTNTVTQEQITCSSVQLSEVFVPDGTKVSFWRAR